MRDSSRYLEDRHMKDGADLLSAAEKDKTRSNEFKLQEGRLPVNITGRYFLQGELFDTGVDCHGGWQTLLHWRPLTRGCLRRSQGCFQMLIYPRRLGSMTLGVPTSSPIL